MRTKLIINPRANRGHAVALLPQITAALQQLAVEFDIARTESPGQSIDLARQAAEAGYDRVVAMGGDGTCHEVVNGLLLAAEQGRPAILGLIPLGSGNDFAYALGIPADPVAACAVLKHGSARLVDAGRVTVDGQSRFFANSVGVGLDAAVTLASTRIELLRGHTLYFWSALTTIAFGCWPYSLRFSCNGEQYQGTITLLTVANGQRVGGGFYLTPQARIDDGLFDVCYATGVSRLAALTLLPKALKGAHLDHQAVTLIRSDRLEILAEAGIPGYTDGEILCERGRHFELEILPGALQVWS